MKKIVLLSFIVCHSFFAFSQKNKKEQDVAAIKQMCGCYKVTFEFGETFSPDTAYKFHDNYKSGALEWVELVEDKSDKLVLQHLLVIDDTTIIKHWRQDWLYQNTDLYVFDSNNKWKFITLSKDKVKGQWTQKVFQVDDSPRYEGSATWVHVDGRHYWENTADAPLPRREFTKRSDYNVLGRRNRHEITSFGWIHEQDNNKILREGNSNKVIAKEKGWDTYTKVADVECLAAQKWWKKNSVFWADVRKEWDKMFAQNKDLELEGKIENKPLFMHLFAMDPKTPREEISKTLAKFQKK